MILAGADPIEYQHNEDKMKLNQSSKTTLKDDTSSNQPEFKQICPECSTTFLR